MSFVEDNLNCVFCNESFDDKETLQIHFRKHGDPQFKKVSPPKSEAPEHDHVQGPEIVQEKKVELVSCDVCTDLFPTISKAITHKHKMHPDHDAKYFCCWCGKLFTLKHLYNKHLTSHEGESRGSGNIYHCDSCNVDFNLPSAMIYHNKIFHRQDTDLSTIGHSTKQKLVDEELCQLYYCTFCGEEYINKVNLHKHMNDDHGDENKNPNEVLRCPLCQAIFYHLDAYEVHLTFHSSEDMYHDIDATISELSEFTLDSVPPITENVEDYDSGQEAKSPTDSLNIDQLLQLASEGGAKKRHKKHKKHKKSKKSAITLDEFLNMNTDVFGEGLNFQGAEEVPTQVVSKQLKAKRGSQAKPAVTVKKKLDKLKQQGIVIKKKTNNVPVFPGVKNQLGMQNQVQKPLKIAPCALKPISNVTNAETQSKLVSPKTNEEVLSKLLNQSHSQIQITKKSGSKDTEESVLKNLSDTPEKIEVECDLLLRSSEPSSELDREDNEDEDKTSDVSNILVLTDPTKAITDDSKIMEEVRKTEQCVSSIKADENLEQKTTVNKLSAENLTDSKVTHGKINVDSLVALKSMQHLTVKQLIPSESNPIQDACTSEAKPQESTEKDLTDSDFEKAIPASKIINSSSPSKLQARTLIGVAKITTPSENSEQTSLMTVSQSQTKPSKNKVEEAEKEITKPVTIKPAMKEKEIDSSNSVNKTTTLLKNMSQQISIKLVGSNTVKPSALAGRPSKESHDPTSDKSTEVLKNLSKYITVKSVNQTAKTSNDNTDKNSASNNVATNSKKAIPMPQGNIKHFPQITVKPLSQKGIIESKHSDYDDDFDSDVDNEVSPKNLESALSTKDNQNQLQIHESRQQSITNKISQKVLNNKQIIMKSSNQTFTSISTNVKDSYAQRECVDREFSDSETDVDISKQEKTTSSSYQSLLTKPINKNVIVNSVKNISSAIEHTTKSPHHSPNATKVLPANDRNITGDDVPKRIGLLQKLNQGITIKTVPQKENITTGEPEIFNIVDSDSDEDLTPAVSTISQKSVHHNRSNVDVLKNTSESPKFMHSSKQPEQLQAKKQCNQQQAISSAGVQQKWPLVKHTPQTMCKSNEDMQNDYFSTDEEDSQRHSDSDCTPDVSSNISKLLRNKNICLKNLKISGSKQPTSSGQQFLGKAIKKYPNEPPKTELLKDFHFNESSEEDVTGKELAIIRQSNEIMSDTDDDFFEDIDENVTFQSQNQDIINKLKGMNANVSFKSNNPSGLQMLNKVSQNLGESAAMKSSSNQSTKTVTCTQSLAMKREASEAFAGNSNNTPAKSCKQIKLAGQEPTPEDGSNSRVNQSKASQQFDINSVNQEVTTSVKTIQTKTVVQEITTTVTRTIKTVNQEVAVMSTQVSANSAVTNAPRMPKFVKGMPRTLGQVRNNVETPVRVRAPTNIASIRPTNPTRPSLNTAIRSPNNASRMRPPGVRLVRPVIRQPPMMKSSPVQVNQPQPASKPIKIAPSVLKQQQQRQQQQMMKRVAEAEGPFSCFKKPDDSFFPSTLPGDSKAVASTSQISHSNFSSSTKTFKSDSFGTATKTKSEVHSSHQEIRKLSNLSGLKVVRTSQSAQATKEVQMTEVADPKRQSTLEAIQRLQKQGLLMKKPRVEEPDSDSGCEDNDNPNLAIEDGG